MTRDRVRLATAVAALPVLLLSPRGAGPQEGRSPVILSEPVYERAPFPSAHASTIVETADGLLAAWFGGTDEGEKDVGIWVARRGASGWSAPVEVADGRQPDGSRHPCWNPVLFQPSRGPLVLFYKVGKSPREWWGLARTSTDEGTTWSEAVRLPDGFLGPVRAKPVELPGGDVLAGSSTEHGERWLVHMERWTPPLLGSAAAWRKTVPLNDASVFGAIQPTILPHGGSRLQILCRSRQKVVTEAWSEDGGKTWGPMTATGLPNPSAGIDALRLRDGRFLLVSNPTTTGRHRLEVAASADGKAWRRAALLEDSPGEYSYPAAVQSADGLVHVTYTWQRRRIQHAVLDPASIR